MNRFGILADLCQAVGFDGQGSGKAKNKLESLEGPDVQFGSLREGDGRRGLWPGRGGSYVLDKEFVCNCKDGGNPLNVFQKGNGMRRG